MVQLIQKNKPYLCADRSLWARKKCL